ncbi:MAG: sulfotransferase [Gammaproteobacteria bacterium]|nr:sulfotransferase [Gammaproteobacteria bacterium]
MSTDSNPFFILGCVRSGTTLLRDLLQQHENLCCPQETHFFRWADPFGTNKYASNYRGKALFKEHREADGIDNFSFFYTLNHGANRKYLMDHYMHLFLEANNKAGKRWFDKSPQNVYGLMLLSGMYPQAKFIHVHRHPYNVIASLKIGKVLKQQQLTGAINFWVESLTILSEYKKGFPHRILELSYGNLTKDTLNTINEILLFLNEKSIKAGSIKIKVHGEKNQYLDVLTNEEMAIIDDYCGDLMDQYGYSGQR